MPPGERREYAGNAPPTTLSSGIDNATLTIPLTNGTGWPTGSVGPFFVVIDKGLTTEEKVKVASRTANTLTVAAGGRGQDGTAAATHAIGASAEHVVTADDMNIMNQHLADPTLDHHTQYLNATRHAASPHVPANLDMVSLLDAIWPAGTVVDTAGTVPTTETTPGRRDWLACDGALVNRLTYARLYASIGTTYGAGDGTTTFQLPDFRGRVAVGAGTGSGLTARANGQTFGAETFTLAIANLPAHDHTINDHTHGGTTAAHDVNHWHGLGGHVHWVNGIGNHEHMGPNGFVFVFKTGSPVGVDNDYLVGAGTGSIRSTGVSFTDHWESGTHDHGNTGGPSSNSDWVGGGGTQNHSHSFTTGGASNRGTSQTGAGTAVNKMPPSLVVTKMIKS